MSNIPVVYEDEWLLIANKPSGLLTIPTPKGESRTLTSILNEDLKKRNKSYRLHPSHRLDRETSGLIIYAKGKSVQRKMMGEFKRQRVKKTYVAFVQGHLRENKGKIRSRIKGINALTNYKIVEKRKDFCLVEVMPLTGRTNQIRIHFRQIGSPIVGESKFAFRRDFNLRFRRLCLHAKTLEFSHPVTKRRLKVDIELPSDLKNFLKSHA